MFLRMLLVLLASRFPRRGRIFLLKRGIGTWWYGYGEILRAGVHWVSWDIQYTRRSVAPCSPILVQKIHLIVFPLQ
ncbi:hypothetical protein BDQ12DRAFT_693374 [Crucibulum laeve]|uniref:Secreted protein n=1 Tax=Crucibulum laeve TaxID=68775 RepID=A0A5C3LGH2_9AGAR|nr:hypothetical protein BDQ12DRAFT_693374 [Crucibulum laeve]